MHKLTYEKNEFSPIFHFFIHRTSITTINFRCYSILLGHYSSIRFRFISLAKDNRMHI